MLQIPARSLYLLARPSTPEEVRAENLELESLQVVFQRWNFWNTSNPRTSALLSSCWKRIQDRTRSGSSKSDGTVVFSYHKWRIYGSMLPLVLKNADVGGFDKNSAFLQRSKSVTVTDLARRESNNYWGFAPSARPLNRRQLDASDLLGGDRDVRDSEKPTQVCGLQL